METRANYVLVGIFALVSILAAFAFVYWTAAIGDRGETVTLRVRIPGSASGLGRGSAVLFNGVRVGDVRRVYIDVQNPTVAIADADIDRLTPITKSTQADIGLAGLTGQASIELKGADPSEANLLDEAEREGRVAEITANPSTITNLLQTAQDIFTRADSVLNQLEGFANDVRGPLTETVRNAEKFSLALADNSDGVDKFLESVTALSEELAGVSGKLDGTLKAAEDILTAIDPKRVETIVGNVETFTNTLGESSERIDEIVKNVDTAVASLSDFAGKAGQTLSKVDGVLEGVDAETVRKALSNIERASASADKVAADIAKVTDKLGPRADDIDRIITDAGELADRLSTASARVDGVLAKADDVLTSVDGVLEGVDAETVRKALSSIEKASANADKAAADIAKVTEKIAPRADDVDRIITDAQELAGRLNKASERVDGILVKVDKLLGSGEAEGVITDASETLKAFKRVADTLNSRLATITDGLARFSGQGLRDVEALVRDSRRSITRIEQAVSDIERNPQRIITGGEGTVREYNGRTRR
jgi:phospholipid/cholesterol/gamma-HCH transport system substrate-binding protein